MGQNVLAKQIVDNIINSIKTFTNLITNTTKHNLGMNISKKILTKNILKNIAIQFQALYKAEQFNETTINELIDGIKNTEFDVTALEQLLISSNSILEQDIRKTRWRQLRYIKNQFMSMTFGKIGIDGIFEEIARQKLTLLAYRTEYGYKVTLCDPNRVNEMLQKILPNVVYNGDIKINNCSYFGVAYPNFCEKYICNMNNLSKFDIAIIPPISDIALKESSAMEEARRQYKNVYERIFKFFNDKNVPISLQQTSACKGNNFAFALSENIDGDTKIDKLEFSTLNILYNMVLPNFYSKYADTTVKCFYNKNINHLKVHFNFPVHSYLTIHGTKGSIVYATDIISKILEKAENKDKTEQISTLNKVLKSFDNTINIIKETEKDDFINEVDVVINDKQFLEKLKDIKTKIDNINNIHQPFKEWIFTSIDEFAQQNPQNAVSFAEILKNSKFYDEKTMSPTLAGFEVLEKNKNTIQAFMSKYQITEEDLNKANQDVENNMAEKKDTQEKSTNINSNIAQANTISLVDTMKFFGEMQKEAKYTKDQQQSNNVQSDVSLQTLNDEKKKQEAIK